MKRLVIVGNGGFARETKWLLESINKKTNTWDFLGFIDKDGRGDGVIGNDDYILNTRSELAVVLAIGNSELRKKLFGKYKMNAYVNFPNLIAPSVDMSEKICFGEGNIICANNILTVDLSIGSFNIINLGCTVGHDTVIGNFNTINPGTNISGNVTLGDCIEIGTGAKIIQGKKIGSGTVIGAGAVVIKDIPKNVTAVGVPAVVIKDRETDE